MHDVLDQEIPFRIGLLGLSLLNRSLHREHRCSEGRRSDVLFDEFLTMNPRLLVLLPEFLEFVEVFLEQDVGDIADSADFNSSVQLTEVIPIEQLPLMIDLGLFLEDAQITILLRFRLFILL